MGHQTSNKFIWRVQIAKLNCNQTFALQLKLSSFCPAYKLLWPSIVNSVYPGSVDSESKSKYAYFLSLTVPIIAPAAPGIESLWGADTPRCKRACTRVARVYSATNQSLYLVHIKHIAWHCIMYKGWVSACHRAGQEARKGDAGLTCSDA